MIEVEVLGAGGPGTGDVHESPSQLERIPPSQEIRRLCELAAGAFGVHDGHVAIEFVDERRIAALNERYRALAKPTDVLSFPVDGTERSQSPRELGDVLICLAQTVDVREAIVHGVLHLLGMDHETDDGEMLTLQRELLAREPS
jgi:probable rRNA maturation factor